MYKLRRNNNSIDMAEISEKTITISIKTAWIIFSGIIFYTVTVVAMYFGIIARVTNTERKIVEHEQAVKELSDLKADMREVKVRMEDFSEVRSYLREMDSKLDKLGDK